jgi:hypothetical protein
MRVKKCLKSSNTSTGSHVRSSVDILEDFIDYSETELWQVVTDWLDEQKIPWDLCADFASENSMVSYRGQIYVDITYDEQNVDYRKLEEYLENSDGTMRIPNVTLCCLSLSVAMRNAHHDEPGFWQRWAEDF